MKPSLDFAPEGACVGKDPDLFFPGKGMNLVLRAAQAICAECPVRLECAEWGIHHESFGVWGGLSERARKRERARRGIALVSPLTQLIGNAA